MPAPQPIRTPPVNQPVPESAAAGPGGRVAAVNPLERADWDRWVSGHPQATFFHGAAWARVLVETYGYTPMYLVADRPAGLPGILPLMEVDSWLTGRRGIGLPFTDECEPLCDDPPTFQTLFQSAQETGRTRGWKHVECRGGGKFLTAAPPMLEHYSHDLNLALDEPGLFAGLDGAVRRAIRKAEKAGVTVEVSQGLEAVKAFYFLLGLTRKRHGLPPQPFHLFQNIYRLILQRNMGVVVVARKGHTLVGAAVYFRWGDGAIYKYGASDERFQHLRGNNLVMWSAIKWCVREGLRNLHLGRTSLANPGLRRFKLSWGAREEKIAYYKFDLRRRQFVVEHDETEGWHNRVFRAAPVFASRLAGRLLYRHWA